MNLKNFKKRLFTSILLLFLIFLIYKSNLFFTYTLIILGILSLMEFTNMTKIFIKNKKKLYLANFSFLFYIISVFSIFFISYNYFQTKIIMFSLLFCCVASDIGGFVFGNLFKGPKLSKISPNKTISGALGSLILSSIVLVVIFNFLSINFSMIIILIAIITSSSCQLGDLFFSYLKRKAKIKDTGNFFPGHGGVLDRLDGLLLGIPIGFLSIIFFY